MKCGDGMNRLDRLVKIKNIIKVASKRSYNYAIIRDMFASNYPQLDFGGLSEDYLSWLKFRYIDNQSEGDEVIYPIDKALTILKNFSRIQNKWKSDLEFRDKLSREGFNDILSIEFLSLDEMEKIISLDTSGLTVRVQGVRLQEGEYLGKFGEWNLWLPYTKESSAKIAGYNPVTYESDTEWCTAITRGSNLFYNYVGKDSFLFYIIKDNPIGDEDWLTLGVLTRGSEVVLDLSGKDGGLSVNRVNEGLTEEDYSRILGDHWSAIKSRIYSEVEKFKLTDEHGESRYESPSKRFIFHLAKNISDFKKEFAPKSNNEKKEFISLIMGADPSEEVRKEILLWEAKTNPAGYINRRFNSSDSKGYYDINLVALKGLYSKDPMEIFSNKSLYQYLRRGGRYDSFMEDVFKDLKAEKSGSFLKDYVGIVKDLGYNDVDDYLEVKALDSNLGSKLSKLSKVLDFLGMRKESSRVRYLSFLI
jgi:hypothetical protein